MTKIQVGVIDKHPLFRAGVIRALAAQPDMKVVGQGASAVDAIHLARESKPDVIVVDGSMSDCDLDAFEAIMRVNPRIRILILTGAGDEDQVRAAFDRGAHGYMAKDSTGAELVQAVRALNHCERYVSPRLAAKLFMSAGQSHPGAAKPTDGLPHLTPREEQILSILSNGRSNKEIGNKLDLSEKTVKHHVTNILQKLKVRNRVEAALVASKSVPQRLALS